MVTTWHGTHHATWWGKKLYNSALVRGTRVIAISRYIADRLTKEYGVTPEKLRLIPRGADPVRFDPASVTGERIQRLAEAWDLPHGARVILMPARLTRWKGQGVLVDALAKLRRLLPSGWVCVFIGPETDPAFAMWLSKRVSALELRSWVRFAGNCADMTAAYALADVVVAPSLRPEPFGRTVVEAQLMGKPVIGTAQGAMMETIIPDETGVVIPPDDSDALANELERLLTTEADTLAYLAENARAHVLRDYTVRKMQAATLGVYDEILGSDLRQTFEGGEF
ncbi:glycosyltransferase [Neokomagataea thailandica NBRC 106555]|nr:glycosyltransferase [Neokomagataea thailandica NBRC 106555]